MVKFEKKKPTQKELDELGVNEWGTWTKEVSEFPWEYDSKETFYVLEGEAEIDSEEEKISFGPGDLVTCYPGLKCTWKVNKPIKKHYRFGD
jgi:hypothetical protein